MTKWPTFGDFILKSEKCPLSLIHVLGLDLHVLGLGLCVLGLGLCVLGLEKILMSLASILRSLALLQHWHLQHINFQNFSRGACPRTSLELSLFLNQLQMSSTEKNTPKNCWKYGLHLLKLLATPQVLVISSRFCCSCIYYGSFCDYKALVTSNYLLLDWMTVSLAALPETSHHQRLLPWC